MRRATTIKVALSDTERAAIQRHAERRGLSLSALLRMTTLLDIRVAERLLTSGPNSTQTGESA